VQTLFGVLVLTAATAAVPDVEDKKLNDAIDRGVQFLLKNQEEDGNWKGSKGNFEQPGITSLAVLALLSAGDKPGANAHGAAIEKGALSIIKSQKADGLIAGNGSTAMYEHGIATLMLAETAAKADADLKEKTLPGLKKAVALIVKAQKSDGQNRGGWRYRPDQKQNLDSDMSVTGWQVLALYAAKQAGCQVPTETLDQATTFIKRSQTREGGFGYHIDPSSPPTSSCTRIDSAGSTG
jgi:prenyltransferase beta subunit